MTDQNLDAQRAWETAQNKTAPEITKQTVNELAERIKQDPYYASVPEIAESIAKYMLVLTDNTDLVLDIAADDDVYELQAIEIMTKASFFAVMQDTKDFPLEANSLDDYLGQALRNMNSDVVQQLLSEEQRQALTDYINEAHEDGLVTKEELFDFGVLQSKIGVETADRLGVESMEDYEPSLSSQKAALTLFEALDIEPTEDRIQNMASRADSSSAMLSGAFPQKSAPELEQGASPADVPDQSI